MTTTSGTSTTGTSVSPPPPPRPRPRPRLYPAALLPVVALVVIEILCHAPQARYGADGQAKPIGDVIAQCVGRPVGLTLFALLVAVLVFLLSNRRAWVANLALALTLLVCCGLSFAAAYFTSLGRAAEISTRTRAVIGTHVQRAAAAQRELDDAGSISVAGFDRPGELEARLALLERLQASMAEALVTGGAAYDALPQELDRAGVFRRTRAQTLDDVRRDLDWPRGTAIYAAALPLYEAAIALFRHLEATKGAWSVTPGVNDIEFHTPQAKARGDELRDALARAAQRALAAMQPPTAAAPPSRPASAPARD